MRESHRRLPAMLRTANNAPSGAALCSFSALFVAAAAAALGGWAGEEFATADYITYFMDEDKWASGMAYTPYHFWMLALQSYLLPLAWICLGIFAAVGQKALLPRARLLLFAAMAVAMVVVAALALYGARALVSCGVFCFGTRAKEDRGVVGARYSMYLIYFFVALGYAAVFGMLARSTWTQMSWIESSVQEEAHLLGAEEEEGDETVFDPAMRMEEQDRRRGLHQAHEPAARQSSVTLAEWKAKKRRTNTLLLVAVFAVLYPTAIFASMALPNMWKFMDPARIQAHQNKRLDAVGDHVGAVWNLSLQEPTHLKLFADVLAFYAFVYVIVIVALLAHIFEPVKLWLHKTSTAQRGCSRGEILLWAGFACLLGYEAYFWYFEHGWMNQPATSYSSVERAARTLGQLANCVMGLMILPVSRNSIWSIVFELSWEAMIRFHRVLGYIFLGTILLHMLCWWKVFDDNSSFPRDIFATPTEFHSDNFTIPLATLASMTMFVAMGVLALEPIRRRCFELFYWSHFVFLVLFIAVLWHASSAWYFLLPGLSLWAFDQLLRFVKSSSHVKVISMQLASHDVVELSYHVERRGGAGSWGGNFGPMEHGPGQYCFVNIPQLSLLEWHPFTISSSPGDAATAHHIKVMGGGKPTFTERLQELTRSVQDVSVVQVNVDGPYGLPIDYSRFRSVLFVAGGIGITPIHSRLRDLWRAIQARQDEVPEQVRLVWVTRDPSMFESFAATLDLLHQLPRDRLSIELYCSSKKPTSGPLLVRSGRPDLAQHISPLQLDGMRGLVFVCGPASLSADCAKLASEHGVAFHSETFEL